MKKRHLWGWLAMAAVALAAPAGAQAPRGDVIWARSTNGAPIVLDGVLDEPAWAAAESVVIRFGINTADPGSGWKVEGGLPLKDSTRAVLKFLTVGNVLYIAATVRDSSVGGSDTFNRFDGFLMGVKDHANASRPAPVSEYFYAWWAPQDPNHTDPGKEPNFFGRWAVNPPHLNPRTPEQIAAFDAKTYVHGLSNSDAEPDTGYTTEMRINLDDVGYDVTLPGGDIVEWNVSIYDCDWLWPLQPFRLGYNRVWWQDPWGNTSWFNEVRIHGRPDVTVASGPAPAIGPELLVPNGIGYPVPVIDGKLDDAVWSFAPYFDLRYGDDALRDSYPSVGKWRSGQYQPQVNGGQAFIEDPGQGRFYYFFRENSLYLGFDVNDFFVGNHALEDQIDGFLVTVNDRVARGFDRNLETRRLQFRVGADGEAVAMGFLPFLRDTLLGAQLQMDLKPGTTVDTLGGDFDTGWTAELVVDLTKLGYPHGLGDGTLWFGVDLYDGDTFTEPTTSYGTRTWWYREREGVCCPVWAFMDPALTLVAVGDEPPRAEGFSLLGSYPNPTLEGSVIRFVVPQAVLGSFEVYDARGRAISRAPLGLLEPGERHVRWAGAGSGMYFYRLRFSDPSSGSTRAVLSGKLMSLR